MFLAASLNSLWGEENPYQSLWEEKPSLPLTMQLPASVAATLGWNQLEAGTYDKIDEIKDEEVEHIELEVEEKKFSCS